MHKIDIIVLVAVVSYAGFRVYQKYIKKEVTGKEQAGKPTGSTEGDDYEPYSNK